LFFEGVVGQYLPSWRNNRDYKNTVSASRAKGGGVLRELSHEIDYLRWIFGDYVWVSARIGRLSNLDIDVEDTACLSLGLRNYGFEKELMGTLTLDFIRPDSRRNCIVVCEHGSLKWDGLAGTVSEFCSKAGIWVERCCYPNDISNSYAAQIADFLNDKEVQRADACDVHGGKAILQLIEAAEASGNSHGRSIVLHPGDQSD
jgi:predicted dehydrogenase